MGGHFWPQQTIFLSLPHLTPSRHESSLPPRWGPKIVPESKSPSTKNFEEKPCTLVCDTCFFHFYCACKFQFRYGSFCSLFQTIYNIPGKNRKKSNGMQNPGFICNHLFFFFVLTSITELLMNCKAWQFYTKHSNIKLIIPYSTDLPRPFRSNVTRSRGICIKNPHTQTKSKQTCSVHNKVFILNTHWNKGNKSTPAFKTFSEQNSNRNSLLFTNT